MAQGVIISVGHDYVEAESATIDCVERQTYDEDGWSKDVRTRVCVKAPGIDLDAVIERYQQNVRDSGSSDKMARKLQVRSYASSTIGDQDPLITSEDWFVNDDTLVLFGDYNSHHEPGYSDVAVDESRIVRPE